MAPPTKPKAKDKRTPLRHSQSSSTQEPKAPIRILSTVYPTKKPIDIVVHISCPFSREDRI